jgi:hypothetical protein
MSGEDEAPVFVGEDGQAAGILLYFPEMRIVQSQ